MPLRSRLCQQAEAALDALESLDLSLNDQTVNWLS